LISPLQGGSPSPLPLRRSQTRTTLEVFSPVTGGMSVRITLPNEKTIEFQTSAANLIGD
jgi:hypothetical protein